DGRPAVREGAAAVWPDHDRECGRGGEPAHRRRDARSAPRGAGSAAAAGDAVYGRLTERALQDQRRRATLSGSPGEAESLALHVLQRAPAPPRLRAAIARLTGPIARRRVRGISFCM